MRSVVGNDPIVSQPRIIGVGGFASNVGKTTLMCELLRAFPGWEAIKTTRGHYRSCGKDPHACCVSHLLSDEPVLRSGREETYAPGKDTGRYWDAGAANVHWLIATDEQIAPGIKSVLKRVKSGGVFVEGNSFSEYVQVDAFIMAMRSSNSTIKNSARRALAKTSALYIWSDVEPQQVGPRNFAVDWNKNANLRNSPASLPRYTHDNLSDLILSLRNLNHTVAA